MNKTLLLLLCIGSFACNQTNTQQDRNFIDYENCIKKPMDEIPPGLLGKKEYVLLDNTHEECFTKGIHKVTVANERIYILDHYTQKIVVFNKDGKAIAPVGKRGQGPEEYLNTTNFTIDKNGNILFIDGRLDKLFTFDKDLNFKGKTDLPFEADILHALGNDHILWGLCTWNKKACKGMKLARTDRNLNVLDSLIEYNEFVDPAMIVSYYNFVETDKHLIYHQAIDNHILLLDKEGNLEETLIMNFGKEDVPNEYKKNIEPHWDEFTQFCLLADFIRVTDKTVSGILLKHKEYIPFIYDRKSHVCHEGETVSPIVGYDRTRWITYLESTEGQEELPDSVVKHLENEGIVLCFQELK